LRARFPLTALFPTTAPPRGAAQFSASAAGRPVPATAAFWLPALLVAGAVSTLFDRPEWPDWLVLGLLALLCATAATVVIARRAPAPQDRRRTARF
jgi:hypothetical protein